MTELSMSLAEYAAAHSSDVRHPATHVAYEQYLAGLREPTFCPDCGDRFWSWGSHAERCYGVPRRGRGGEKEDA